MTGTPKSWLVIGSLENWLTSLRQPIPLWGLRPTYAGSFESLNAGDIVWIYATNPIKGVVGVASVKDKYVDESSLVWPEEIEKAHVIWPLRFRLQILKYLPESLWRTARISINEFDLNWQRGFQALGAQHSALLAAKAENLFGLDFSSGPTIVKPQLVAEPAEAYEVSEAIKTAQLDHRSLQELVAEISKLQFYHTELEYAIDLPGQHRSLDVVWKREMGGSPTFAFEVELSAGLEKAIGRLKFAYRRWNSRPRIIAPNDDHKRVHNLLLAEERDFSQQLRIYEPSQLTDLLQKKRDLKTMEQDLGMY